MESLLTPTQTSFADSLLSQESDLPICVYADEKNYPVEDVSALIAHICVIDAPMMELSTRRREAFEKHIALATMLGKTFVIDCIHIAAKVQLQPCNHKIIH